MCLADVVSPLYTSTQMWGWTETFPFLVFRKVYQHRRYSFRNNKGLCPARLLLSAEETSSHRGERDQAQWVLCPQHHSEHHSYQGLPDLWWSSISQKRLCQKWVHPSLQLLPSSLNISGTVSGGTADLLHTEKTCSHKVNFLITLHPGPSKSSWFSQKL